MQQPVQLSTDELAMLQRGEPLRLKADGTQELVVVLAEQYERLKRHIELTETDPKTLYPLIADVAPEDWQDISDFPHAERL